MKSKTEYAIYKKTVWPGTARGKYEPEYWDGPFQKLKDAERKFKASYMNTGDERKQDFIIAKVITEFIPHDPDAPKKRTGSKGRS